jgi:uncharacterized protein
MSTFNLVESPLDPKSAVYDAIVNAGDPWIHEIRKGQVFRILDLEGNQAVDTLFYNAHDPEERYSAADTVRAQGALYLTTGTQLMSTEGRVMLTITADTCGRHDTLGGACSCESNTVRYALNKRPMHSCRDSFLHALAHYDGGLSKRDITSNINFFMNVPVTPAGGLSFADGVSSPGKYVEMRAEMDVLCLISNCPQLNNPCNAYNPTPVRVLIWDAPGNENLPSGEGQGRGKTVGGWRRQRAFPAGPLSTEGRGLRETAGRPAFAQRLHAGRPARRLHVRQGSHRQPRRHRLPHHPHPEPNGGEVGRRLFRGRPSFAACAAGRRGSRDRPGAGSAELPARREDPRSGEGCRRSGDPPRLRFPLREPRLRRGLRRCRHRLHRAEPCADARFWPQAHCTRSGRT